MLYLSWCRVGAAEEASGRRSLFGRSEGPPPGASATAQHISEYPLYCDSDRDRPRFAGERSPACPPTARRHVLAL